MKFVGAYEPSKIDVFYKAFARSIPNSFKSQRRYHKKLGLTLPRLASLKVGLYGVHFNEILEHSRFFSRYIFMVAS